MNPICDYRSTVFGSWFLRIYGWTGIPICVSGRLLIAVVLWLTLISPDVARADLGCDWWSSQTSPQNVYEPYPESVRLHDYYDGFIEGVRDLPHAGNWLIDFRVATDGEHEYTDEYTRIFFNDELVAVLYNQPVGTHYFVTHVVSGSEFSYRFEFHSPAPTFHHHMRVDNGTVTSAQVFYANGFDAPVGSEWSSTLTDVTPSGRTFLGQFQNDTVSLTLDNLPPHTDVHVSFELFIIRSWDGNDTTYGPDIWDLSFGGGPGLLHTTFSNGSLGDKTQAYPDEYPGGDYLPRTGADEVDTLGYEYPEGTPRDAVYDMAYTFSHYSQSVILEFSASGLAGSDETWGLDSVEVSLWCEDCLIVDNTSLALWGNHQYDAIYIINGGSIVAPEAQWVGGSWEGGHLMLEADTIYIDSTSSIRADACGFSKDDGNSDGGLGHGEDFVWEQLSAGYGGGEGAGHAGRGGSCQWTTPFGNGGEPYGNGGIDPCNELGDCDADVFLGSAGGDYIRWTPLLARRGGRGGGYVRLIAHTELTIEGDISADGGDGILVNGGFAPPGAGSGGGSGGYVVLSAPELNLTGTLSARGGAGSDPWEPISSGGGAGGRIIVAGINDPVCVPAGSVAGGQGGCYGAGDGDPGSVHIPVLATDLPLINGLANDSGRLSDDLLTSDPTLEGVATPDSLVKLYVDSVLVGSGQSDPSTGEFAVTIAGPVDDGEIVVAATAQEACANESAPSEPFTFTLDRQPPATPSTPDLSSVSDTGQFISDDITHDATPTFDGTAEIDAEVILLEGEEVLASAITPDGNWSMTSSGLAEGLRQISATAVDAAGNESVQSGALSVLIDLTDPVMSNPSVTPSNCPHPGADFDVQVNVADALSGVVGAWSPEAAIRLGDAQIDDFDLTSLGGSTFGGLWNSASETPGVYAVDFEAWDLAGNSQQLLDGASICLALPADLDEDGDVDLDDFGTFAGCMLGPGDTYPSGCEHADFDTDVDCDVRDFAQFQSLLTGGE